MTRQAGAPKNRYVTDSESARTYGTTHVRLWPTQPAYSWRHANSNVLTVPLGRGPFLYRTPSVFDASDQSHAIGVRWLRRDPVTSAAGGPPRGATGAPCRAPAVACVCGAARATRHGAGAVRPIGPAAAPAARRAIASARPDAASRAAAASGPASGLASRRRRPASACRRRPRWRARSAAPGLELGPGLGLESVLRRSGRS